MWTQPDDQFDAAGGGQTDVEADCLVGLARHVARAGMIGFDTGCFTGWSARQVWPIFGAYYGHFYCVDWFKGSVDTTVGGWKFGEYPSQDILLRLLKNIEVSGALDFVSVLIDESWRIASIVADESIDYVYIGGDHRYSGIMKDLNAWWPKVRKGGVICGHAFEPAPNPTSPKWKKLCHMPEQDFYDDLNCHFGVNRALHEKFGLNSIGVGGDIWSKFK